MTFREISHLTRTIPFYILISLCSWAGWFEHYLVVNPEDMVSSIELHISSYLLRLEVKWRDALKSINH